MKKADFGTLTSKLLQEIESKLHIALWGAYTKGLHEGWIGKGHKRVPKVLCTGPNCPLCSMIKGLKRKHGKKKERRKNSRNSPTNVRARKNHRRR